MSYILLVRNPSTKKLIPVVDENGHLFEYDTDTAADTEAEKHQVLQAWGYQVVQVE